jgi:hypothetical protein
MKRAKSTQRVMLLSRSARLHLVVEIHDASEARERGDDFTSTLIFHECTSWPSRVMWRPHEKTRHAPGRA